MLGIGEKSCGFYDVYIKCYVDQWECQVPYVDLSSLLSLSDHICVYSPVLSRFCASVLVSGWRAGVISPALKPQTSAIRGERSILQVQAAPLPWTTESCRLT